MTTLTLWSDYSREEVHSIFSPNTIFTSGAGTWGLQGIIKIPDREGDFIFFVTFGQEQGDHAFDESITTDGVLSWQSQPSQRLTDKVIQTFVLHDERLNTIHLFLRTNKKSRYSYLGKLGYLTHDKNREAPVYFQWQLLDWPAPESILEKIDLALLEPEENDINDIPTQNSNTLLYVEKPVNTKSREGVTTESFQSRKKPNYAQRDHKNRQLGLDGELLVIEHEKTSLLAAGRPDLADKVMHTSVVEGDGSGYDVLSFFEDGRVKYLEIKTTKGFASTPFFISPNEVAFSDAHPNNFCLVRVFGFDNKEHSGKAYTIYGSLSEQLELTPIQYRAVLGSDN